MRTIRKKAVSLLLALVCVLPSLGCADTGRDIIKSGIEITEDPPYSIEVAERAEETMLSLMRYAYLTASSLEQISSTVDARLSDYAERIGAVSAESPISEAQYIGVIDALEQSGRAVVDELLSLYRGESALTHTRELYLVLSGAYGAERAGAMLYDVCLVVYDMKYEIALSRFENYGYPWYEEEANALLLEKQAFIDSVGREAFSALLRCSTAFAEIIFSGIDQSADVFFDSEILLLLQSLDVDKIGIKDEGYALLMSYIAPKNAPSADAAHLERLRYELYRSGDSERVAAVMEEAVTLINRILANLTSEDIRALRERDYETLWPSVFSRFSEEDWEIFSIATGIELSNGEYSLLSEERYGEEYTSYLESLRAVELETLRSLVGTDEFYEYLRDYLIGICPAIAYEVSK